MCYYWLVIEGGDSLGDTVLKLFRSFWLLYMLLELPMGYICIKEDKPSRAIINDVLSS